MVEVSEPKSYRRGSLDSKSQGVGVIIDTNALSAFAGGEATPLSLLKHEKHHHLLVIVLGEYRYGHKRSRECQVRERWLDQLEAEFEVLALTRYTAQYYALIREQLRLKGTPIPENDIWTAALAREHALKIVSCDTHFDWVEDIHRVSW